MKRQILVKVWQKKLTPEQALEKLIEAGPKPGLGKKEEILDLLLALRAREITTTEAEEEMEYEQSRTRKRTGENLCQIN